MSSNKFKFLREKMGLSQMDLGEKLGVTQQSVYAWERGDALPRLQTAIALAELYNVSIDYILGRTNNPSTQIEPTVEDDELRARAIDQVSSLSDPELERVMDFLAGLSAGREIAEAEAAARDPDAGSHE